jgi:hypothetical protein
MLDQINSLFPLLSVLFILNNVRVLFKEKDVRGVSIISVAFFSIWALWNVLYYHLIGQDASFYASMLVVIANSVWLGLMIFYKRKTNEEI